MRETGALERRVEELLRARAAVVRWPGHDQVPMKLLWARYGEWARGRAFREWEEEVAEGLLEEGFVAGEMSICGDELRVPVTAIGEPGEWPVADVLIEREMVEAWREAQDIIAPEELAGPEVRAELWEAAAARIRARLPISTCGVALLAFIT